ncbi:MAG: peptidylprolyl isomerase [Balneolales bacterium]|nr:peptidylprolyl isomerase [Balneolales bacterium]
MITNRILLFSTLLIITAGCASADKSAQSSDTVVGVVAGENIYLTELKEQFYRSGTRADDNLTAEEELKELQDFLPLYIDYRAKLVDARNAGYFDDEEISEELSSYEIQTAYPYWLENKVREQLLDEFAARADREIAASHILITLPQNPNRSDTLRAYNRLIEARDKALAGESFDSLSVVYSSTQQGRSVGGDLGYFTAGWAVKDFEDVAFSTAPGEISMPFRTQFGYHIIKVRDIREVSKDRLLSHIFFQARSEMEIEEALERGNEVFDILRSGTETWDEAVVNYSMDGQSAPMGGRIGWVNHGRYDPQFTNVVMEMETVGGYTEPFFSGYGVHIIRLDSIRTYESEELYRTSLLNRLKELPRYRENREFTTQHVRKAGDESINLDNIKAFEEALYNNRGEKFSSVNWGADILESPLYRINNTWYIGADYLEWIKTQVDTATTNSYHYSLREKFFNKKADTHVVDITKDVFPEFAKLSREYMNGLVIFKISEDSVWNYARTDSNAVRALYDDNPDRFQFDTRYFYYRVAANNDSTLNVAVDLINSGVEMDSLRNYVSNLLVRADVINDLSQEPFSNLNGLAEGGISEPFDYRNRRTVFLLDRIEPARRMTFDEAYFRVVSEYQPIREQAWLDRLRDSYGVVMYPERITIDSN